MNSIKLRPVNVKRDFGDLAVLFSLEDEPITEAVLREDFEEHKNRIFSLKATQAVKVLALRYACQELGVNLVRANNNPVNYPMIAVNRKPGYNPSPGEYTIEKILS